MRGGSGLTYRGGEEEAEGYQSKGDPRAHGTTEKKEIDNRTKAELELERCGCGGRRKTENSTANSRKSERNAKCIAAPVEAAAKKRIKPNVDDPPFSFQPIPYISMPIACPSILKMPPTTAPGFMMNSPRIQSTMFDNLCAWCW